MCGIISYIGPSDALPVLLDGLRRLEYRGYDSAGIATVDAETGQGPGRLHCLKAEGKLDDDAYMKRWLNDPDNRFFRTRPGQV